MHRIKALFRGRRKLVSIPLLVLLIPTAAYAAFAILFGIGGSVTTANVTPTIESASLANSSSATCSITKGSGSKLTVSITKAFPGGSCEFRVNTVMLSGTQDTSMVTQDISYVNSPYVTTKFNSGSCGRVANTSGVPQPIDFTVKIAPDAPMGTTYPAQAAAGISLVPSSDYVVANCPTW